MLRIYYHHYVPKNDKTWIFIFLDQLKAIEDSGLFDAIDVLKLGFYADQSQIEIAKTYVLDYPKIQLIVESDTSKYIDERYTLNILWSDSFNEDFLALYINNKGNTYFPKYIQNSIEYSNYVQPQHSTLFRNVFYWRKYLEWGCVENWKKCVDGLRENDVAGVNYNEEPFKHYSGNWWWVRSGYLRQLDNPADSDWWRQMKGINAGSPHTILEDDRFCSEFWPLHKAEKIFVLHSPEKELQFPNHGIYSVPYRRNIYHRGEY